MGVSQTLRSQRRHGQESISEAIRRRLKDAADGAVERLSERGVASEFSVSRLTARRAMRDLVRSGHLRVNPRRGYWPGSPLTGGPAPMRLAWVKTGAESPNAWPQYVLDMLTAVQRKVLDAGGSVVSIAEPDPTSARLNERLLHEKVDGVILDCDSAEAAVIAAGLSMPCVVVNTSTDAVNADVLVQDNSNGGYLAATHLLKQGHGRIAWLGAPTANAHARERLGGFLSAFVERGLRFDPTWAAFTPLGQREPAKESMQRLLALRPTAIVVLWTDLAAWAWQTIQAAGLRIPDDISLIAWGSEENFPTNWWHYFEEKAPVPDAIQWRMSDMADTALSRLTERQRNPLTRPAKLFMPVKLTVRGSSRAVRECAGDALNRDANASHVTTERSK